MSPGPDGAQTVIRISPMAHITSGFIAIALLALMPAFGRWGVLLFAIPILISVGIARLRTVADADTVTAHMLIGSRTLRWADIEGLRFTKGRWARACRHGQADVMLPAVTFSELPRLTAASGGRVPNPYP